MLELTRLPDWDRRLARLVNQHKSIPGVWGVSDCLLTVADAVEAITGTDPAADIRGKYKTEAGAARILRKRGFGDVEMALASLFRPVGRLMAQRGDIGVVENGVLCAGFVTDLGFAVKTEAGLSFVSQMNIKSAFKVG
ncbi:MAG: hypothetical protein EOS73_15980 [Mesorhizobium sp.]|uniref:DUF6950 family protein n=1 Tax=Mesorhizobium sp. M7A.F.Ca.ET.027.02.1.1 TaxID=2496655 RepID=UPI000FD1F181|nr:hypothetical protein [Mesorhizobium sp. M7A.F.Ca.ET.027.02.1.1]RVD13791.1 hypothetical protein EN749_22190 [Mesorhizobium sp. M7A.F.Ca.ET.027.02.1.1]RWD08181.1 MAG: hypothetical protein EOS73_15980 [Mesorhizobium sp.]